MEYNICLAIRAVTFAQVFDHFWYEIKIGEQRSYQQGKEKYGNSEEHLRKIFHIISPKTASEDVATVLANQYATTIFCIESTAISLSFRKGVYPTYARSCKSEGSITIRAYYNK